MHPRAKTFVNTYGRAPRELRKANWLAGNNASGKALTVILPCRKPFNWQVLLEFFGARAIPAVECVVDKRYLRTLRIEDKQRIIELHNDADNVLLTLHGIETGAIFPIVQRCREVFDLDPPMREINDLLSKDTFSRMQPAKLEALSLSQNWRLWRAYAALLLWSFTPGSGG